MSKEKNSETSYEKLIEKALDNAIEDREKASVAYDSVKDIFNIDVNAPESLQGLMLVGQTVPKLLELAHKSNEQIIKLAQLREKEKSKAKKKEKSGPISMQDIKEYMKEKTGTDE